MMIDRIRMLLGVLAAAGLAAAGPLADHFGVNLAVGPATLAGHAVTDTFTNSWTPVPPTADYVIGDWYGKPALEWDPYPTHKPPKWAVGTFPNGGEPFDVEALYFDDDMLNIYIAVVTSVPAPPGYVQPGHPTEEYGYIFTGDLSIGVNGTPYAYGIDINLNDTGPDAGTHGTDTTVGNRLYSTAASDWYLGNPEWASDGTLLTNFDGSASGTYVGDVTVTYTDTGLVENEFPVWLLEITIPRALIPEAVYGTELQIAYSSGCRNDLLTLTGTIDSFTPIPEPGTAALTAMGAFTLLCLPRRRR